MIRSSPLSTIQMGAMGGDVGVGFSHHHINGGGRKYQCKMCPQVGIVCETVSVLERRERYLDRVKSGLGSLEIFQLRLNNSTIKQ